MFDRKYVIIKCDNKLSYLIMKIKIVLVSLLMICGLFIFYACDNTSLSDVGLASKIFTYTGETISPVFSHISSGCEIDIYNEENQKCEMVDAGNYIIKVKKGGNTKVFNVIVNKKQVELHLEDKVVTYNGNAHRMEAELVQELDCEYEIEIEYNRSYNTPSKSGEYLVEATLNAKNYYAYAISTLTIQKANCEIELNEEFYEFTGEKIVPSISTNICEEYEIITQCKNSENAVNIGEY